MFCSRPYLLAEVSRERRAAEHRRTECHRCCVAYDLALCTARDHRASEMSEFVVFQMSFPCAINALVAAEFLYDLGECVTECIEIV